MKNKYFLIMGICTVIILLVINSMVFASTDPFSDASDFIKDGESKGSMFKLQTFKDTSDLVYNILISIGVAVAVIGSAILGIQFIIGGVEEKALIKEKLIPFMIGCVVVFGAFGIWKMVTIILGNLEG